MTKIRHWMRKETHQIPLKNTFSFRNLTIEDAELLAPLMDLSYQGTIDHEGETPEQCLEEMQATLSGKYGPFLEFASFVIEDEEGKALSASLVTLYKDQPLLAYSMTLPEAQGKGMSRFLIERSVDALATVGFSSLYLAVTEGNVPAQNLYKKLGFAVEGPT